MRVRRSVAKLVRYRVQQASVQQLARNVVWAAPNLYVVAGSVCAGPLLLHRDRAVESQRGRADIRIDCALDQTTKNYRVIAVARQLGRYKPCPVVNGHESC